MAPICDILVKRPTAIHVVMTLKLCLLSKTAKWRIDHLLVALCTQFLNQIQPERSATDQFSSNYHFTYIYQSFQQVHRVP